MHNTVMNNNRKRTQLNEKEVRFNADAVRLEWSNVEVFVNRGLLSPTELADFGDAVRKMGHAHLDSWSKVLGNGDVRQSLVPMMEQVCETMPVYAIKRSHSKCDIWIVDAHNLTPGFIAEALCLTSHSGPDGQANIQGEILTAQVDPA